MIRSASVTRFSVDVTVDSKEARIIFPGGGYIPIPAHRIKYDDADTDAIGKALVSLVRTVVRNTVVELADEYGRPAELEPDDDYADIVGDPERLDGRGIDEPDA